MNSRRYNVIKAAICSMCLLFFVSAKAQTAVEYIDMSQVFKITLEVGDERIETYGIKRLPDWKLKLDEVYAWYDGGQIQETQGYADGNALHGDYEVRHATSNKIIAKGQYERGQKVGVWMHWDDNGKLLKTVKWKNSAAKVNRDWESETERKDREKREKKEEKQRKKAERKSKKEMPVQEDPGLMDEPPM